VSDASLGQRLLLSQSAERFVQRSRPAARSLNPAWQGLVVDDVIPDHGGRHETFEVARDQALIDARPTRCARDR